MRSCRCYKEVLIIFLVYAAVVTIIFFLIGCSLPEGSRFDLYEENDIVLDTDSDYTQGALLKWTDTKKKTAKGFGQIIKTPDNKQLQTLQPKDRPYGAFTYGMYEEIERNTPYSQTVTTWNVGTVGPWSLGRETQNGVHKLIGDNTAKGWEHQLNNEIGVVYRAERQNVSMEDKILGIETDNFSTYGVNLGNVKTDLFVSNTLRLGENLPSEFGSTTIPKVGMPEPFRLPRPDYNFFTFFGGEAKLVARDIFLDGNTFGGSHRVDKEWMVGELRGGFSVRIGNLRITYTLAITTPEFREKHMNHGYGSLNFSYDKGD